MSSPNTTPTGAAGGTRSKSAIIAELAQIISTIPDEQAVNLQTPRGMLYYRIPAEPVLYTEGTPLDPANAPGVGQQPMRESEQEVASLLSRLPDNQGMTAKQVAAKMQPKGDPEAIAMRLRRMRRKGMVERLATGGFRLSSRGKAVLFGQDSTEQKPSQTEQNNDVR